MRKRSRAELELHASRLARDLAEKILCKAGAFTDARAIADRFKPLILAELTAAYEYTRAHVYNPPLK